MAKSIEEWLPKMKGDVDIVNQTIVIGPVDFRVDVRYPPGYRSSAEKLRTVLFTSLRNRPSVTVRLYQTLALTRTTLNISSFMGALLFVLRERGL